MGFVYFPPSEDALPKRFIAALQFLETLICSLSSALHRFGLNRSWDPEPVRGEQEKEAGAALAKSRMSATDYRSFLRRRRRGEVAPPPERCAVCLQSLKERDQVRAPEVCGHAFHLACIDPWLDLGRLSCPLCRSSMLDNGATSFVL